MSNADQDPFSLSPGMFELRNSETPTLFQLQIAKVQLQSAVSSSALTLDENGPISLSGKQCYFRWIYEV